MSRSSCELQSYVDLQRSHDYRWKLFEKKDRDFIYVRDRDDKNIIYKGYIQDKFEMRGLLQKSSGLIISSIYDPSPKIINEALACSKPILCRNTIGTSGDLVEHLKNGYIYSPNKKNDLENGISWLVKNNQKREVTNYCSLKAKEWSPNQNATSLMKLYSTL